MAKKKVRPSPRELNLPCCGVDTHLHLDLDPLLKEPLAVIERAREAGVLWLGQVFLGPAGYTAHAPLFDGVGNIFFLLGVHPHDAAAMLPEHVGRMEHAFRSDTRLKAVGEIGLDFHYTRSPKNVQKEIFRTQLLLALRLDLPVVVHSREASDETLAILTETGFPGRPVLWHCFGGNSALARRILDNGWMISIPGVVTYSQNTELRQAVAEIPLEAMVLETDAPFLAPEPYRGKTNEPAFLGFTALAVAEIKGIPVERVWTLCAENARRYFGLDR